MSTVASELLIARLRQRGEAAAEQVLLRNRTALAKLSADDRRRAKLLLRAVVAGLLEEPESHLRRLSPEDASGPRLEAVRELFELDRIEQADFDQRGEFWEAGPAGFEPAT